MKVFLIDDQKITNVLNRKYLSMLRSDLDIYDFENPLLAVQALKAENPELIFLDINMPILTGWDVLTFMNEHEINIPVIILTSSSSSIDRDKAKLFQNVFSFQLKPLTKEGFSRLLDDVVKKRI
ncbi:response regulator [Lunatibacter salilacus]|uniref:response regulator n=1 Tax=Lunatibacter salilacus TaxID=2483804 RepID=UPI00131E7B83|nr:response regulator [Lunatibacter salilacus]